MSAKKLYSENEEQRNFVKETAEKLDVACNLSNENEMEELQDWQKKSIERGIEDFENGRFSTSQEVRKGARLCLK